MDDHDPKRPILSPGVFDGGPLRHVASNVSVLSDADFVAYDPAASACDAPRGRESLLSMDSRLEAVSPVWAEGDAPAPSWHGSQPYAGAAGARLWPTTSGAALGSSASRTASRSRPRRSVLRRKGVPASIEEEEYDLALLLPSEPAFDVTSALGPMDAHDADFVRELQESEARGTLTGGLGRGFEADARLRMRDSDLLASASVSASGRRAARSFARAETLREAGQGEANRRGQVVEVVVGEGEPDVDLSNVEGSGMAFGAAAAAPAAKAKAVTTHVFYPQPNWRPFSMRWPYLGALVAVSLGLAAALEAVFRASSGRALVSFRSADDVDPMVYFGVKFAPSLCAVLYGVLWQFTDFEVRRLEAFYQLSRAGGARAGDSINVDYVTGWNVLRPLRAVARRHWAVALSSTATLLAVSLVPTCAAAVIVLTPDRRERVASPGGDKALHLSPVWSRLLTAMLVVCAALAAALFYVLQTRRSGLLADVRGIAGLASMAVVSHILMDFKDMDTATHRDIHLRLKRNRYVLRNSSLAPQDDDDDDKDDAAAAAAVAAADDDDDDGGGDTHLSQNPHPLMLRPAGWVPFLVGSLALTGLVPATLFTGAAVVADKAPWLLTSAAVCLKLSWNAMETSVRVMEPFYILSRRAAPARTLMLDYTALPFGYLPLRALFNGHALVVMVGVGSVLAELLTVLVTGLATVDGQGFMLDGGGQGQAARADAELSSSGQETVPSFYVSLGLTMFILVYLTAAGCIVFARRRHPFLPRQPNTIASVLAYIHQSKMLYDFVGTAKLSQAETARRLDAGGRRYGLGWFEGRDGQTHCGVDYEELASGYKHGVDCSQSQRNEPWNVRWDVF